MKEVHFLLNLFQCLHLVFTTSGVVRKERACVHMIDSVTTLRTFPVKRTTIRKEETSGEGGRRC